MAVGEVEGGREGWIRERISSAERGELDPELQMASGMLRRITVWRAMGTEIMLVSSIMARRALFFVSFSASIPPVVAMAAARIVRELFIWCFWGHLSCFLGQKPVKSILESWNLICQQ